MAGVWPPKISIVYGLWIQLFLIKVQSTYETAYKDFNFSPKQCFSNFSAR